MSCLPLLEYRVQYLMLGLHHTHTVIDLFSGNVWFASHRTDLRTNSHCFLVSLHHSCLPSLCCLRGFVPCHQNRRLKNLIFVEHVLSCDWLRLHCDILCLLKPCLPMFLKGFNSQFKIQEAQMGDPTGVIATVRSAVRMLMLRPCDPAPPSKKYEEMIRNVVFILSACWDHAIGCIWICLAMRL